jgi:hypothetical protein
VNVANRFSYRTAPLVLLEAAIVLGASLLVAWLGSRASVFTIDSYYYLSKAKGLVDGGFLTVPWNDGIDRKFFWGYSLALALPLKLFGEAGFYLLHAALYAWTGLTLATLFRMLQLSPATRVAGLALALFNPVALWWATVPMSEALLVALAVTSLYFALRWRRGAGQRELFWASLLAGLAFLTRVEGAFLALVLAALCLPRLLRERRRKLLAISVLLFLLPEVTHVVYLRIFAEQSKGLIAYLDEARGHFAELHFFDAIWRHLRAPYWTVFRFDTEPWLYARFFPGWLTTLQGLVLVIYIATLVGALLTGLFKRGFAFACALGLVAFAILHSTWYYAYERYDYLIYPAAALVLAWGIDAALFWAKPRLRTGLTLAISLGCAAICCGYGVQVSRMHAERLRIHQGGRDFRAIARAANAENPKGRPFVTDLGPYVAFYLNGHSYFNRAERDFFDDVVPSGEQGRIFFARRQIAAVISSRPMRELVSEFALVPGEFHQVSAPGATVLVLDLPEETPPPAP